MRTWGMVKGKKSAKAILEALKIEMAHPHVTASALAAMFDNRQIRKLRLTRRAGK